MFGSLIIIYFVFPNFFLLFIVCIKFKVFYLDFDNDLGEKNNTFFLYTIYRLT